MYRLRHQNGKNRGAMKNVGNNWQLKQAVKKYCGVTAQKTAFFISRTLNSLVCSHCVFLGSLM
jgi:hypothetical protein